MSTEVTELISQMQKVTDLDEAVSLQRRALAYTMSADAKGGQAVARAGNAMLKRLMAAQR